MNEFESDWISLSQSKGGERVFLSESERRKQGIWIQHGRIQDGCHHKVESEWMSEVFFLQMMGTNHGKCEWVWEEMQRWPILRWPISRWQNPRKLPSSSWVRMNEWIFFLQMVGTNLGKCGWVWEENRRWPIPRWPNSRWKNSRWLPSSSWVRMNEFESDSKFEGKCEWSFFCVNGGNLCWQVWVS